jgi:hypothetical protein
MRAPRVVGLFPILGWQGPPFRLEPSVPGTDHDSITGGKTGPTTLGQQSRQRRPLTHLSRRDCRVARSAVRGRRRAIVRRLAYGRPRRPLEPHRPAPWLLRGASWLSITAAMLLFAPVPALVAIGRFEQVGVMLTIAATWLALGGVALRALAILVQPTPVVLGQPDDEA